MRVRTVASYRQLDFDVLEAKDLVDVESKVDTTENLRPHSFLRAKDVCIVLREASRACQSMKRAGEFRSVTRAQLGVTNGQVAIRTLGQLVNADVKRAVHRLDAKLLLLEFHRRKHRIGVVALVPAREPKFAF